MECGQGRSVSHFQLIRYSFPKCRFVSLSHLFCLFTDYRCVNRIHRIGQLSPVVRVRKFVVTDSVEERIVELQSRKKYVAEEVYNDVGKPGDLGSSRLGLEEFKLIFRK